MINLKERNGIKHNTIRSYRDILRRIVPSIDSMKLGDIRPQHLNKLYKALQSLDERLSGAKAVSKETLLECIKGSGMTREALSKAAEVSHTTVTQACRGAAVSVEKAALIAKALGEQVENRGEISAAGY